MAFFFVSCIIWEKKISRRNFYVALNQDVAPGQKHFDFLTTTLWEKDCVGNCVGVCTDEAAGMTGYPLGVFPEMQEVAK